MKWFPKARMLEWTDPVANWTIKLSLITTYLLIAREKSKVLTKNKSSLQCSPPNVEQLNGLSEAERKCQILLCWRDWRHSRKSQPHPEKAPLCLFVNFCHLFAALCNRGRRSAFLFAIKTFPRLILPEKRPGLDGVYGLIQILFIINVWRRKLESFVTEKWKMK